MAAVVLFLARLSAALSPQDVGFLTLAGVLFGVASFSLAIGAYLQCRKKARSERAYRGFLLENADTIKAAEAKNDAKSKS